MAERESDITRDAEERLAKKITESNSSNVPPVDPGGAAPEQIKPWVEERKSQAQAEYDQLRLTKSFLESQTRDVNDRMVALRSIILNERTFGDPGRMGYGRTETALDVPPRTFDFSPKGILRHFRKSYSTQ